VHVFYSDHHHDHAPTGFLHQGRLCPCPEHPERAAILSGAARDAGHELHAPKTFGPEPLRAVHDPDYLDFLATAWTRWQELPDPGPEVVPNVHPGRRMGGRPRAIVGLAGWYQADTACPIGPGTWAAATAAADVALSATRASLDGAPGGVAYAVCRPPGHHAYADLAGGFCYLNNTAIAAQYCLDEGSKRVAILDVDVHHGNGTQGIFYGRNDVLTVSLHGDPADFYPFYAGYADETGQGDGVDCNLNVPLPRGTGDDQYLEHLEGVARRVADYGPDVLLVALGLDASGGDPLAFLNLSTQGFHRVGRAIGTLGLTTVLIQEGGYVSDRLGANLAATLEGFESAREAAHGHA
jgi:acetoin utilization deacetylase AcuC-like enzyme